MSETAFRPLADEDWVTSSASRAQSQQQLQHQWMSSAQSQQQHHQEHQQLQGQSYLFSQRNAMPVARRPFETTRRRGVTSFEYGAPHQFPQTPHSRNQRPEFRRTTQPGYGNNMGGYDQRRLEGPRHERSPLDAARVWNAFAYGVPAEEVNNPNFRQGREDQHNLASLARTMPRTDPRGRPTPGLMQARALAPPTRPGVPTATASSSLTHSRPSASTSSPVSTTRTVNSVSAQRPQESERSDAGTGRPLGQAREPVRMASSSSRNESTPVNTADRTAMSAANQVTTETLISITTLGSGAGIEGVQDLNTSRARESDPVSQPFVSALVADLLDLDFSLGSTLDTTQKDWSEALDGAESEAEAQDPAKSQESELSSGIDMVLIDFSVPDPVVSSIPTPSSGYIDNLFGSMDQHQIVADLIGTLDQSTSSLASQFTNRTDGEAIALMVNGSDREDIQELYGLKAVWEEEGNDASDIYGTDIETGTDSDNDSDDSDVINVDPWRILGDDKIYLGVDALENIRMELQQSEVTWEQLLSQVKL